MSTGCLETCRLSSNYFSGFDPAIGDVGNSKHDPNGPIAGMNLRPIDFEWVTTELVKVADICCNGRLVCESYQRSIIFS